MKKLFIFLFVTIIFSNLFSQTEVNGIQSGSWTYANSPYLVTGDISVPLGSELSIEPGVEVNFQGNYKFTVSGSLQAIGTADDSIYFTTDDIATGWHGIRMLDSQSGSELSYCRIEFGKTVSGEYPDQHGGAVMLLNSDAVFNNCTFAYNEATGDDNGMGGAVYAFNTTSNTQFNHCYFKGNHAYGEGGAIKFSGDNGAIVYRCKFIDNTVLYGGGAICLYSCYDTKIRKSLFVGNFTTYSNGGAALVQGYCTRVVFANCTMIDNHASGGDAGGVDVVFSEASFTNCIIYNNPGAYSDDIFLDFGYAEINYCNTQMPDGAEGSHNINVDAQFVDANNGDFHLLETSPCIDSGIDSLTITTAYGDEVTTVDYESWEYVGDAPDMGCYEYGGVIGIEEQSSDLVNVFPNPVLDRLNIQTQGRMISNIIIYDFAGKIVMDDITSDTRSINISHLAKGVYFVKMFVDNQVAVYKVEKE